MYYFFFNDTATTEIYTLSLHDALPIFENGAVREAFQRHGVVKLKADWTNGDPAITKLLQQFGRPGVPLYVLYPGGTAQPYVFPELLTKNIVLEKLETVNRTIVSQ